MTCNKGERGYCIDCTEFNPVEDQKLRKKDWRLKKGYCGATSITIIPKKFWNPFSRREETYGGNLCIQNPDKKGKFPYNPIIYEKPEPLPPNSI